MKGTDTTNELEAMLRMIEYMSSQVADHVPNPLRLSQLLEQVANELTYEIGTANEIASRAAKTRS